MEKWKQYRDTPYYVSADGEVSRKVDNEFIKKSQRLDTKGYPRVGFRSRKNKFHISTHILVVEVWIGPRPLGLEINHINGIKTDNRVVNLEYVTKSENRRHALRTGLAPPPPNSGKLTEEDVRSILRSSLSQVKIAKKFNISPGTARDIRSRRIWKWVTINPTWNLISPATCRG